MGEIYPSQQQQQQQAQQNITRLTDTEPSLDLIGSDSDCASVDTVASLVRIETGPGGGKLRGRWLEGIETRHRCLHVC